MQRLALLASLFLAAATSTAQSPLTTTFANNNAGGVGGGVYFDLTVNPAAGVNVRALDLNFSSTAGTPGSIELWTRPGSYVGFENSNVGWTRIGVASCVAQATGTPTRCVFPAPVNVPTGVNGVAICAVGLAHAYTNGNGTNQTYSTAELTLQAGSALNVCFAAGAPFTPRVVNCNIYYGNERFASVRRVGTGCVSGAVSFYQLFNAAQFDLGGSPFNSIQLQPLGGTGYLVTPGSNTFVPPTTVGLGLTDDSLSGPRPLGFTLNYPGGSTTDINICSNGFIHLLSSSAATTFTPTVTELLSGGPRLCPMWCDLLPDGATNVNNVYFETAPNVARITWNNCPYFGGTGNATMQVTLNANGLVEFTWGTAGHTASSMITGFSPGVGNRDGGNIDISASLPFTTSADAFPLSEDATNPLIGTTVTVTTSSIPSGSIAGVHLLGGLLASPLDLTGFGAPGCSLHVTPIVLNLPYSAAGSTATTPFPIPNQNSVLGAQLTWQAVTVTPGLNILGIAASNAVVLTVGNI